VGTISVCVDEVEWAVFERSVVPEVVFSSRDGDPIDRHCRKATVTIAHNSISPHQIVISANKQAE